MSFASPGWLIVGIAVVATLVVAVIRMTRRRTAAFAAAGLTAPRGRQLGVWLTVAGLGVLAIAVAGPAASVPVTRASGTVIVALDVSNSMTATDVTPTRLAAAKSAATTFVEAQPQTVDVGVVAFQSDALQTSLASADHSIALSAIDRINGTGGTSLSNAILAALSAITGKPVELPDPAGGAGSGGAGSGGAGSGSADDGSTPGETPDLGYWGSATIVLFSDGEDFSGSPEQLDAVTALAQGMGVHIETVGVGTTAGTTVDVDGYLMQSALDEATLIAVAEATGGTYHPATDEAQLAGIADGIDLRLTTKNEDTPLAGALSVLAIALLITGSALTVARTGRLI